MDTAATDELSPEALRQLVGSLKPGQIRHLKLLLDNRYVVDLMVELPLELICLVASHLDPVDYRACLCVSKEWRHRFLAEPLWRTVMDSNFHILPVQAKAHDTCVDFDTFRKHLRRVACRSSGVAQRQFKVSMTEDFVFPPENSSAPYHPSNPLGDAPSANLAWWDCPYMLYADGKVAWGHLGVGSVVLDCLRTGVRSIVPSPVTHIQAGNHNKLLALGDQLVVWAVAHRV